MKKILVTMLALSLAAVSTVDAKRTGGRPMSEPVAKRIDEATADLQNAPAEEKDAAFADLVDALGESNAQKLVQLEAKRATFARKKEEAKKLADAKKSGFGWLFQSGDHKEAKKQEADFGKKLADVNKQIRDFKRETRISDEESKAIYAAMGSIATFMGLLALERYFGGAEGYVGTGTTRVKAGIGQAWEKVPSFRSKATSAAQGK